MGVFAIGWFASDVTPGRRNGDFLVGGSLLGYQIYGIFSIAIYSGIITALICYIMKLTKILRVSNADEEKGLDVQIYDEEVYVISAEMSKIYPEEFKNNSDNANSQNNVNSPKGLENPKNDEDSPRIVGSMINSMNIGKSSVINADNQESEKNSEIGRASCRERVTSPV